MTIDEFRREFDISYNNIMSNAAPAIDDYEKSVFLTKAQESIVTAIYAGSFETSEQSIESLNRLVETKEFSSKEALNDTDIPVALSKDSKFFKFNPDDRIMFITYEALDIPVGACGKDRMTVLVKPTKQDEYYRLSNNPFRKARWREALRLNTKGLVEIISTYPVYTYKVRYMRRPNPIILYNANWKSDNWDDVSLSINGENHPILVDGSPCELDPMLHATILDSAVQLAAAAYKSVNSQS